MCFFFKETILKVFLCAVPGVFFLGSVKSVAAKIDLESLVLAFATCPSYNLRCPTGRAGVPVCFWWRHHRSLSSGSSSSCCSPCGRGGGNSVWTRAWGVVRALWGPGVSRRQSWRRDHLYRVQPAGTRQQTKRHTPEQLSLLLLLPRWASLRGPAGCRWMFQRSGLALSAEWGSGTDLGGWACCAFQPGEGESGWVRGGPRLDWPRTWCDGSACLQRRTGSTCSCTLWTCAASCGSTAAWSRALRRSRPRWWRSPATPCLRWGPALRGGGARSCINLISLCWA